MKIYGSFEDKRNKYIVLEFINGETLEKYIINKKGELDENTILLIIKQISSALKYLHDQDIMHRDIKPDNILLTLENDKIKNVKITDFGEAAIFKKDKNYFYGEDEVLFSDMTQAGCIEYAAPEIKEYKYYNVSVDIYSFGILLIKTMFPCQKFDEIKNKMIINLKNETIFKKEDFDQNFYSNKLIELALKMINFVRLFSF